MRISYMAIPGIKKLKSFSNKNELAHIVQVCCKYFNVTIEDLKSQRRYSKFCYARHFVAYFARFRTTMRVVDIAAFLGNRHWTSVVKSCNNIKSFRKMDDEIKKDLANLEMML